MLRMGAESGTPGASGGARSTRSTIAFWVRRRAIVLVVAAYVVMAFGYLWPFDPRGPVAVGWAAFMVRTFAFHAGLALLAVMMIGALAGSRRAVLAACPLLVLCVWPEWPVRLGSPDVGGPTLRVMSINLLASNRSFGDVLAQIEAESPDVILLQEYKRPWMETLAPTLEAEYPFAMHSPRDDAFGCAMYSRIEPLEADWFELAGVDTPQVRAVVEHDGGSIAIYGVHLLPPASLAMTGETWAELDALSGRLEAESLAVLVAGDFNFTPRSAQAGRLRSIGLREAHASAGRWRGATWPVRGRASIAPGIRLDQAYASGALGFASARVLGRNGSDHLPIVVDVGWRDR